MITRPVLADDLSGTNLFKLKHDLSTTDVLGGQGNDGQFIVTYDGSAFPFAALM